MKSLYGTYYVPDQLVRSRRVGRTPKPCAAIGAMDGINILFQELSLAITTIRKEQRSACGTKTLHSNDVTYLTVLQSSNGKLLAVEMI